MGIRNIVARLWSVAAVLTLATGGVTLTAPAAAADSSQCPNGSFCVWEHSSYTGRFLHSGSSVANVGNDMNDRMTSYWNRTGKTVSVYEHSNYTGCMISVAPGRSEAAVASHFNDKMTSFRVGSGC
ncbi:peptidase inhibitor family I36 protein [Streptomyces sp. NBRC 109706]|uniref:peptidase inhibitor family I36 protein n=1 Tax=Streptomyces sp. NBRC 109706 TaxID=1550035 RepID=UPI000780A943|nr:peptidase inhibitor family I36 protein [Streptomyces sp. NBRC 109706]